LSASGVVFGAASEEKPRVSMRPQILILLSSSTQSTKMDPISLLLIQLMEALSLTATSPSDQSLVSGRPKILRVRQEETSLVPPLPFMELEPPFAFSMPKTTKLRS